MAGILGPNGSPVLSMEKRQTHPVKDLISPPTPMLDAAYQQLLAALGQCSDDQFFHALKSATGIEVGLLTVLLRDTLDLRGLIAQLPADSTDPVIQALREKLPVDLNLIRGFPGLVPPFSE